MRKINFDKIYSAGQYTAEDTKGYIIRQIGSDQADGNTLKIDRVDVLTARSDFAPLFASEANLLGPLDLRDNFLVIPPGITFEVSATGSQRLIGDLIILEAGEVFPRDLIARFDAQRNKRVEPITGEFTVADAAQWLKDEEKAIYLYVNEIGRRNTLNHLLLVHDPDPEGISEDNIGVVILHNDLALDIAEAKMGRYGIQNSRCPLPPRYSPILVTRTKTITGDGTARSFTLPDAISPVVKLMRVTHAVANTACTMHLIDDRHIYYAVARSTTAAEDAPDRALASAESFDITTDKELYPPRPDKLDLAEFPIVQEPGHKLEVRLRNISGADYTASGDQTFKLVAISVYERVA